MSMHCYMCTHLKLMYEGNSNCMGESTPRAFSMNAMQTLGYIMYTVQVCN